VRRLHVRLLDADILIDVLRGWPPAVAWIENLTEAPRVPGFVALELIQGCRGAADARTVGRLLAPLTVVWPDASDCESARREFPRSHLRHGVGILDALIAATAIGLDATLCTFNVRHYRAFPRLKLESPYER
jgi:tRNA(fMet)-specific endonuclease VapC